eukprot:779838-Rhodomonas_salina.1
MLCDVRYARGLCSSPYCVWVRNPTLTSDGRVPGVAMRSDLGNLRIAATTIANNGGGILS